MAVLSFLTYLRGIYKLNLHSSSRVHNAIIQSIYDCFTMAEQDIDQSKLEMCLLYATEYWLDCWGEFFSVYRKSEETDEHYRTRIINTVIKPKLTVPAIKKGIADYMNFEHNSDISEQDIIVYEPWEDIAKYSHKGLLSKNARFYSHDYYSHAILDIKIPDNITQDLIYFVNSIKAAGVKILWSISKQYDIIHADSDCEVWCNYIRNLQTLTWRNQYSGLILSNSTHSPTLSGRQEIWCNILTEFIWGIVIFDKKTKESVIITKKDLLGLVEFYTEVEEWEEPNFEDCFILNKYESGELSCKKSMSGDICEINSITHRIPITDEMLQSISLLDNFLTLSHFGKLSTNSAVMLEYLPYHELFGKINKEVEMFIDNNERYFNDLQPPILNKERVMWLIKPHKNWIWDTPTLHLDDFQEYWEVPEGFAEQTIDSLIQIETKDYEDYMTFGDKYQPPIIIMSTPYYWSIKHSKFWMYDSPTFTNSDWEQLYFRQVGNVNPTLEEIINLEESGYGYGYSVVGEEQPVIEIKTEVTWDTINVYTWDELRVKTWDELRKLVI